MSAKLDEQYDILASFILKVILKIAYCLRLDLQHNYTERCKSHLIVTQTELAFFYFLHPLLFTHPIYVSTNSQWSMKREDFQILNSYSFN